MKGKSSDLKHVSYSFPTLLLTLLQFAFFEKCLTDPRTDQRTDQWTDRRTDRWMDWGTNWRSERTDGRKPLIELHFATKKRKPEIQRSRVPNKFCQKQLYGPTTTIVLYAYLGNWKNSTDDPCNTRQKKDKKTDDKPWNGHKNNHPQRDWRGKALDWGLEQRTKKSKRRTFQPIRQHGVHSTSLFW